MTLTLNRPERLNSFNDVMHQQLAECLKQAERDETIRCLLITGAGRGFCAGQDLNDRNVDPNGPAPDLGMSVETFYNPLVRRLAALPKPVICAVNGVAAGAGHAGAGVRHGDCRALRHLCNGLQQAGISPGLRRNVPAARGRTCPCHGAGAAWRQTERRTGARRE